MMELSTVAKPVSLIFHLRKDKKKMVSKLFQNKKLSPTFSNVTAYNQIFTNLDRLLINLFCKRGAYFLGNIVQFVIPKYFRFFFSTYD